MGDSSANDADSSQAQSTTWAQQWIEQQRALLEQAAKSGAGQAGAEHVNALAGQWTTMGAELGNSYLSGLARLVQSMGGNAPAGADQGRGKDTATPGAGEMFDTWKAAWSNAMSQASSPGGWTELLSRTPPLGLFREQTEAWRAVVSARADMERLEQELAAVLRRVQAEALVMLEEQVKSRAGGDKPIQGFRELYDLWVDCSEKVFNTVAHSSAYAHLQGELGNASMRLRARMQKVIEQGLKQFDLPTRSELNSVHLQLRSLKQKVAALEGAKLEMPPPQSSPGDRGRKVKQVRKKPEKAAQRTRAARPVGKPRKRSQ
jgi:class III poly(R)-hydroxyalkanoic acid synthase PhaE subunit